MHQALYRLGQFLAALLARVSETECAQAKAYLPQPAWVLFRRMPVADQRHGWRVMRGLQRAGVTDSRLLAAALLHDVGKSEAGLTPIHRAIIVLLGRFWPSALARLAREPAEGWRRPFVIHRCHPALGAQSAARAGCDPLCTALIQRHQEELVQTGPRDEFERWLAALQRADASF
jgi:hypothetical protein